MTSLQQHEYLFELVHDSVMTRTMEGRINFWNHSAEELYGWRKEEALGKVSHNLLQTQFPKPLEEIESELLRNGLWEGKLVHTTRDGGRVVVESRWTLYLKGQSGAVVEINTQSTDWEIHPEARTDEIATERKQAQTLLEQTVTPLQQHEHLFELVHDSIMTRTMEGKINFWNHSAEELYGWRKEEALGKVSHNLLQTQFPKPLREIDSELVRNGLWEGKLVHTTRDGGRVVVESRWTLDLTGQSGAVVEINTPSADWEIHPEARTDIYSAKGGRQDALPPSKLVKKEEFLPKVTRLADTMLAGAGVVCLFVFSHFLYYYAWTGQRQFSSQLGVLLYYVCPAVLTVLFFASLRLHTSSRINLALLLCSAGASIYTIEILLTLWSKLPSVREAENRRIIAKAAKALGVDFDTRSDQEVIHDLRRQGVEAFPSVFAQGLLTKQNDGTIKSVIGINGIEVLPIAGIADKLTVLCNESGQFFTYRSDEHGFHNPKGLWDTGRVDMVAVGDSFVQGYCVASNKNFVSVIRQRHPATLNLGIGGNGPLTMLATIKEYSQIVKPKLVLWFYFEGNDLADLKNERKSPLLSRYLAGEFRQNLFARQPEIDRALINYVESINAKSKLAIKLEEVSALLRDRSQWQNETEHILKLGEVRQRLGLIYGEVSQSSPGNDVSAPQHERDRSQTDLLYKILLQAKQSVSKWGGKLYFIYLPAWDRYAPGREPNPDRDAVLHAADKAGLPVIDVHRVFMAQKDPLGLFPFRLAHHYNEEGHRLIAQEVLRSISVNN